MVPVDAESFRRGMRHVPTVVTVVTFDAKEGPCGIRIGSFVSLSLDPPLICFNINKDSSIYAEAIQAERFLVHVLMDDQADVSDRFADPTLSCREQLDPKWTEHGPHNIPTLEQYLVRFDCRRTQIYEGGDHSIFLGCVEKSEEGKPARPLVYHQRAYHAVGDHMADRSI